ncbi:MAG: hypothetical protein PHC51_09500 [bacterium]|nr:hypothetical protein [bacterium]
MRHIPLKKLIKQIFADVDVVNHKKRLFKAHMKLPPKTSADRQIYIRDNGTDKWSPIKDRLTAILGNKCWYTEVELVGAPLTIDHYRPSIKYWWLAFDAENYRVSCPYANSPKHNAEHGCAGGKGDNFPLLAPGMRATGKNRIKVERPVILDPCSQEDCNLIAFQVDGRPILNPAYAADLITTRRVDESMILLNLDHPDFNSKREQLYHKIAEDVTIYEDSAGGSTTRTTIRTRMEHRLSIKAEFSSAARFYLNLHRHLDWVEDLLQMEEV